MSSPGGDFLADRGKFHRHHAGPNVRETAVLWFAEELSSTHNSGFSPSPNGFADELC